MVAEKNDGVIASCCKVNRDDGAEKTVWGRMIIRDMDVAGRVLQGRVGF